MSTKIEVVGDKLLLTVGGFDVVLALRKHLELPLSAVTSIEAGVAKDAQEKLAESIRVGANLPGLMTTGSFYEHGKWMFWNVHAKGTPVTIGLSHEKYEYLVVDVESPDEVVAQVRKALGRS